jgi:LysM repeat protein
MKRLSTLTSAIVIAVLIMLIFSPAAFAAPNATRDATAGGSGCSRFYSVRPGDTLYSIARRFGTTVWTLTQLNGISNPNRIYIGQTLCVRAGGGGGMPSGGFLYTVQRGDTLTSIGRRFGWSASYLASVNHLPYPNQIYAGQVLFIPYHGAVTLPASTDW